MKFLRGEIGDDPVIVEGLFRAPVARVYKAWTEPEEVIQWFGEKAGALLSAEIDLRVGGKWCFVVLDNPDVRSSLQGEYSRVETEKCLEFSWRHLREHADGRREETPSSIVTVTFRAEGAATHVHLRHEGILQHEGRTGVASGWDTCFGQLGDRLKMESAA